MPASAARIRREDTLRRAEMRRWTTLTLLAVLLAMSMGTPAPSRLRAAVPAG